MNILLKGYVSTYDKTLVNYKNFRDYFGKIIDQKLENLKIKAQKDENELYETGNIISPFKSRSNLNANKL